MRFFTTLLIFLFISIQANSNDQIKIRFVYMDYIFKNSSAGKKISKNVVDKRKKILKKSKDTEAKLTKQKNDILAKQKILEKDEFEKKVISHQKDVEEFQNKRKQELQDVSKSNIKMTTDFLKKVDQILLDYANDNKIDLILKKETLIVSNSKLDITNDILSIVEKKID